MSPRTRLLPWVLLLLGGAACGSTSEGQRCDTEGYACEDASSGLECREGVWVRLPCRGPLGCAEDANGVSCDTSSSLEGDACALSADGRGLCAEGGRALLECRNGFFVKTATCGSCSEEAGQLVCAP